MSDEDLRAKLMTDGAPAHSALHMLIGSELAEIVRSDEFEFAENAVGCATSRITEIVIAASFAAMKGSPDEALVETRALLSRLKRGLKEVATDARRDAKLVKPWNAA